MLCPVQCPAGQGASIAGRAERGRLTLCEARHVGSSLPIRFFLSRTFSSTSIKLGGASDGSGRFYSTPYGRGLSLHCLGVMHNTPVRLAGRILFSPKYLDLCRESWVCYYTLSIILLSLPKRIRNCLRGEGRRQKAEGRRQKAEDVRHKASPQFLPCPSGCRLQLSIIIVRRHMSSRPLSSYVLKWA